MKKIIFLFLINLIFMSAFSTDFDISFKPTMPKAGNPFYIVFNVKSLNGNHPQVEFTPSGFEVMSRKRSSSLSSGLYKGKYQTLKETIITYQCIKADAGSAAVENIKVHTDGKTLIKETLSFNVYPAVIPSEKLIALTDVSNEKPYLGEGVDLNYHLLVKSPLQLRENNILLFPENIGFLKRFHKINMQSEFVFINNERYRKHLIQSYRIFPEKEGEILVDPLKLQVSLAYSGDPIVVNFPEKKITVLSLPEYNGEAIKSNLVGDHDFRISINRKKFKVNEVVELKLVVTGNGALENFNVSKLIDDPNLEEFEARVSFKKIGKVLAQKSFDFTFLIKGPFSFEENVKKWAVFEPKSSTYNLKSVNLPSMMAVRNDGSNAQKNESDNYKGGEITLMAPFVKGDRPIIFNLNKINFGLFCLILVLLLEMFYHRFKKPKISKETKRLLDSIIKDGPSYPKLFRLFSLLKDSISSDQNLQLSEVVDNLRLSEKAKNYFKHLIEESEKISYNRGAEKVKVNREYFRELTKLIQLRLSKNAINQ